jgi:hypothetical protein
MSNHRVMQTIRRTFCAVGLSRFLLCGAHAAVVGSAANVDYTGGSVSFGYAVSDFTLSDNGTSPFDGSPVSITTRGSAEATSIGFPFYPQPTPNIYFDPVRGGGVLTFDGTSNYSPFQMATVIPFSATASFIGLEEVDAAGTHYGYGEFDGTDLVSYAFESMPGVGIQAGAPITGPAPSAIPEPGSIVLMSFGLVGLFTARRRLAKPKRVGYLSGAVFS